jgi:uncharacterized integral membrane protein
MPAQPASSSSSLRTREPVVPRAREPRATRRRGAGTRTSAAWLGISVGVLLLIALVVFMLQNTGPVAVSFLGMTGTAPLALALLIAGVAVGVVVLAFASLRIGQLRRRASSDPAGARR